MTQTFRGQQMCNELPLSDVMPYQRAEAVEDYPTT